MQVIVERVLEKKMRLREEHVFEYGRPFQVFLICADCETVIAPKSEVTVRGREWFVDRECLDARFNADSDIWVYCKCNVLIGIEAINHATLKIVREHIKLDHKDPELFE